MARRVGFLYTAQDPAGKINFQKNRYFRKSSTWEEKGANQ